MTTQLGSTLSTTSVHIFSALLKPPTSSHSFSPHAHTILTPLSLYSQQNSLTCNSPGKEKSTVSYLLSSHPRQPYPAAFAPFLSATRKGWSFYLKKPASCALNTILSTTDRSWHGLSRCPLTPHVTKLASSEELQAVDWQIPLRQPCGEDQSHDNR